jgi:hypothetical protein
MCEQRGYDYVGGCLIDRLKTDGGLGAITNDRPIWDQFPLGGFVGYPILRADPRKVVLTKGWVPILQGQHLALSGMACPDAECFAQVHHFKWVDGLHNRLATRAASLRGQRVRHWKESQRFVDYYDRHGGKFDINDKRLMMGRCDPEYPHWKEAKRIAVSLNAPFRRLMDALMR